MNEDGMRKKMIKEFTIPNITTTSFFTIFTHQHIFGCEWNKTTKINNNFAYKKKRRKKNVT